MDAHFLQWFLGDSFNPQRQPQILPATLHAFFSPEPCRRRAEPLELSPRQRPAARGGHWCLHELLQDPPRGRILDLHGWLDVCLSPHPHGGSGRSRGPRRRRGESVLPPVVAVLHETLLYEGLLSQDVGLVPGHGPVRGLQHAVEGAGGDGARRVGGLWRLCLSQAENEADPAHHLQSKWLLALRRGVAERAPCLGLSPHLESVFVPLQRESTISNVLIFS